VLQGMATMRHGSWTNENGSWRILPTPDAGIVGGLLIVLCLIPDFLVDALVNRISNGDRHGND
jgi:hypothetical protein